MTNEEAKAFLDNLKICIDEHPVVADWLVEIADRKTEPTISKMEQVEDEPKTQMKTQNSNLTFEKDECAKEYEELGLKELKELIEANRKTENSSEKPNNCEEPQYEMGMGTLKCDNCSEYGSFKCTKCDGEMYFKRLEPKDEPQKEKHKCRRCLYYDISSDYYPCSECVDYSNYSGEIEDEPQTCEDCKHNGEKHAYDYACDKCTDMDKFQHDDEPQTQLTAKCLNCNNSKVCKEKQWDGCVYEPIEGEPQREVIMPKKCKGCDSASKIIEAYSRGFEDGAEAVKKMPQTDCAWK